MDLSAPRDAHSETQLDDALMASYAKGDQQAFDRLMTRHRRAVFGFLLRMLGDETQAEDAMIETFFKLHRAAPDYRGDGRFKAYLFTLAYREGVNLLRKQRRHMGEALPEVRSPGPSPASEALHREAIRTIDQVLETLPENQRAAFLLYYREGLTTPDIARATGSPAGSVRAYLTLARKAVREALHRGGLVAATA